MKIEKFDNPNYLFHYTKSTIAVNKILPKMAFLFSRLSKARDPYEYKSFFMGVRFMPKYSDFKPLETSLDLNVMKFNLLLKDCCEEYFRVGCFCLGGYHSYHKPRMWEQYAQGYKGVCLVFSKREMTEILKSKSKLLHQCKIDYHDFRDEYRYDINIIDLPTVRRIMKLDFLEDQVGDLIRHLSKTVLFKKECDYEGENEYRFVVVDMLHKVFKFNINGVLRAIVLGAAMDDEQREKVSRLSAANSIPLFEQIIHNRRTYYSFLR